MSGRVCSMQYTFSISVIDTKQLLGWASLVNLFLLELEHDKSHRPCVLLQ